MLVVKSIDRFGRSYEEIIEQWRDITKARGASVVVLDMPLLDTRRERDGITGVLIGDIVLQLLSYVAQVERESIHQRQAEGIAAARARGVSFGRPAKKRPGTYWATRDAYLEGHLTRGGGRQAQGLHIHVRQMGAPGPRGRLTTGVSKIAFALVNGSFPGASKRYTFFMSLKT